MKKIVFLALIVGYNLSAQSWQWGKRGGATDALDTTSDLRQEEVYKVVTDSNKNIYVLSAVGKNGLDIDGVTKVNYGGNLQITDVALASFACDGTYRWSKIIGGDGYDRVTDLKIDSQDNIYIAGKFGDCGDVTYPPRIDSDIILSQNPIDCSVIFIAKYNSSGALQWFKRPQPAGTSQTIGLGSTFSRGFALDNAGNSFWLVQIPPGVYANGAFTNTTTGNTLHIFKYDSMGTFVSATPIDIQLTAGFNSFLQFTRNPYNGYFYFTSPKTSSSGTAVVGGQTITHTVFLSCFNDLGQFQWVREDTATSLLGTVLLYNLEFDSSNNIYLGGRMLGLNSNTFLGLTIPGNTAPGFIMKVDPTAQNLIWSTYNNADALQRGAIAINGGEIGFTSICASSNFTWGTQTLNAGANNEGNEVLLARFNRTNGTCIQLTKIPGDVSYDDNGTALAVDASGDYILGGGCGHQLTFTTNSLTATGSQSDFFVAKYSTSVCSLATDTFLEEGLQFHPNPADNYVILNVKEEMQYKIYSLTGSEVGSGIISENLNQIDIATLASGCYLLQTISVANGNTKTIKLLKK